MTKEDLAKLLNGLEYPIEISKELRAQAKAAGLVIVYGGGDDLMEFEGAIHDEIGAPCTAFVDAIGLMPNFERLCEDKDHDELHAYFKRFDNRQEIKALWAAEEGYSWTYKTAIPHASFEVVEDGQPYCRGIVFALADVGTAPAEQG